MAWELKKSCLAKVFRLLRKGLYSSEGYPIKVCDCVLEKYLTLLTFESSTVKIKILDSL